ncbi:AAA family ATPase [Rudanella paleaurantiibacter]|uniref:AAA family ATPase n=1 Tax=Rudanella paleaurantiibacter TaxID=2614655 RepID=A0A7J5TSR4_9BACT|nr:ParA family protein [Rudanella paleaurantiibacter]KAB7726640.1 AAA family ATPase [Rudanella paleaurantiibacter]
MQPMESVRQFLKYNSALRFSVLEREAGLPKGTLAHAVTGSRPLNKNLLDRLIPILNKYGYDNYLHPNTNGLYTKARVVAVINHKGGAGKTTTTALLGSELARRGYRVLLIDLDPQGNLSQILGIEQPEHQVIQALLTKAPLPVVKISENLSLAPSDLKLADAEVQLHQIMFGYLRLKNKIRPLLTDFDYVLIDCPPSLGMLTTSAMNAAKSCLITLIPDTLATNVANSFLRLYRNVSENTNFELVIDGIVFTMVKKNSAADIVKEKISKTLSRNIFKTQIEYMANYQESKAMRTVINAFQVNSDVSKSYDNLCEEYIAKLQNVRKRFSYPNRT